MKMTKENQGVFQCPGCGDEIDIDEENDGVCVDCLSNCTDLETTSEMIL